MIDGPKLPQIDAQRIALRWLTRADVDSLYAVFSDPDVMRYWSRPPLTERSEAEDLLASIEENFRRRSLFQWGVARREDDRIIGTCTLFNFDIDNKRAEIGYALGRRYWGRGYMREALDALVEFAFETLALHRLEADVDPRNIASIGILERLGFQREGYLRERWHVGDEIQDALFYGLLRHDWRSRDVGNRAPKQCGE